VRRSHAVSRVIDCRLRGDGLAKRRKNWRSKRDWPGVKSAAGSAGGRARRRRALGDCGVEQFEGLATSAERDADRGVGVYLGRYVPTIKLVGGARPARPIQRPPMSTEVDMVQKLTCALLWPFGKSFGRIGILWFGAMLLSTPTIARECFWDGSSPICRGRCPAGYDTVKVKACLNGFKVQCCEKLKSTTSDGPNDPYRPARKATPCPQGLVWRERFDGDTVCVLPGERDANRRRRGLPVH
jgi:hypothetical protein